MKKCWKRVLAATLAACVIFCDSSLAYAAESQPIVDASESGTEVEATEIGDETVLPEITEEEVVTEESIEKVEETELAEETEEESVEEELVVEESTEEIVVEVQQEEEKIIENAWQQELVTAYEVVPLASSPENTYLVSSYNNYVFSNVSVNKIYSDAVEFSMDINQSKSVLSSNAHNIYLMYTDNAEIAESFFPNVDNTNTLQESGKWFSTHQLVLDSTITESNGICNMKAVFNTSGAPKPSTTYYYRIAMKDSSGTYHFMTGEPQSVMTKDEVEATEVSIKDLSIASVGYNAVKITWKVDNPNDEFFYGLDAYYYDTTNNQVDYTLGDEILYDETSATYTAYLRTDGEAGKVKVSLWVYEGSAHSSREISVESGEVTPLVMQACNVRTKVRTKLDETKFSVSLEPWEDADNGCSSVSVKIYYRVAGTETWSTSTSNFVNGVAEYTLRNLLQDTTYEYYIEIDDGNYSNTIVFLTSAASQFKTKANDIFTEQHFPDSNFYAFIRSKAGVSEGEDLTREKLENIYSSVYYSRTSSSISAIKSIEGIQHLDWLTSITMQNHEIEDVSVLSQLPNLTTINFDYNDIKELPNMSELVNLEQADFQNNMISEESIREAVLPDSLTTKEPAWVENTIKEQRGEFSCHLAELYYAIGETHPFIVQVNGLNNYYSRKYEMTIVVNGQSYIVSSSYVGPDGMAVFAFKDLGTNIKVGEKNTISSMAIKDTVFGDEILNVENVEVFFENDINMSPKISVTTDATIVDVNAYFVDTTLSVPSTSIMQIIDQEGQVIAQSSYANSYNTTYEERYIIELPESEWAFTKALKKVYSRMFLNDGIKEGVYDLKLLIDAGETYLFENVIIVGKPQNDESQSIETVKLTEWNAQIPISIPANTTIKVTYQGPHCGEFFIDAAAAGVGFEHVSAGEGLESEPTIYYDNYNPLYAYTLASEGKAYASDSTTFTFKLTNNDTENEKTVSVFTSDQKYTWNSPIENEDGTLRFEASLMSDQKDYYASYYKFAIKETGEYYHPEIAWIARVKDIYSISDFTRWDTEVHKVANNTYTLNEGETYLIKFLSYKSKSDSNTKWSLEPLEKSKNWIASMEVQTEKTILAVGESLPLVVTITGEDSNSPVDGNVAYTTSNKAVATVDENGLIKGLKEGTATITVTANAGRPDKQIEKTLTITVSPKYQIIYNGIASEGAIPGGYLADGTPFEFYKNEGTTLVDPVVNEGYKFLGWYSDAKMTKRVESIASGTKANVNLWPKFALINYNISYELCYDGKFAADANHPLTFTVDKAVALAEPIRLGYKFTGWDAYIIKNDCWYPFTLVAEDGIYYIPERTANDIVLIAQWKFAANFSIALNSEKEVELNNEGEEIVKYTITHPYNSATGVWDYKDSSFVIQSDIEGIIPETEGYYNEEQPTVLVKLYKSDSDGNRIEESMVTWNSNQERENDDNYYEEYYQVTDILAGSISTPGNYILDVVYTYPHEEVEPQNLSLAFAVACEKREYPVKKEIEWSAISTLETGLTYEQIADDVAKLMQPDGEVFVDELGEAALEPSNVIFKNSKNKVVSNTAKVTSGIYTVVLQFGENDRFLEEATGTVKITYDAMTNAGVRYLGDDSDGRIVGSTIAYPVPGVGEQGESIQINTTPYVSSVIVQPMIKVPWSEDAIPAAELEQSLKDNGYNECQVQVRITEASKKSFLNISEISNGVEGESGAVVAYLVSGNAAGKANLVFETIITKFESDENGNITKKEVVIPATVKNFTVVNGGIDAVKDISVELYTEIRKDQDGTIEYLGRYQEEPVDADEIVDVYLVEKAVTAITYWLKIDAKNYANQSLESPKLIWKSSNSKLAAVKTAKDGTTTLTIPKNAQGVVDITVTANDAAKNSQSIKLVIVDSSMRLDTTNLTMNSKLEGESAKAYLYPNVLAAEVAKDDEVSVESLFGNTIKVNGEDVERIALYKKVGKSGYEKSDVFDSDYNLSTGELIITFNNDNYPVKAATHTLYVGILHKDDIVTDENTGNQTVGIPTEMYALKIKDICAMPKAPSIKMTKSYETAYKDGFAEFTINLKAEPDQYDDGIPKIQTTDTTKFEVVDWEEIAENQWKLKVIAKNQELLTLAAKQTSKVIKGVEFKVAYKDYRGTEIHTVKTNLTVTKNVPKLYTYGEDAYAPVYYTDANYRLVDVVIPVTNEIIDGFVSGGYERIPMSLNNNSSGAVLEDGNKELSVTLTDSGKFEVVSAECCNDYDEWIPAKKDYTHVEQAIVMTVRVNDSQKKAANLQFNVKSSGLSDGVTITTQKLTISPRKVASESLVLYDWYTDTSVKTITFNSNYAGKERAYIYVAPSKALETLSEANGFYHTKYLLVEAVDKNTEKMLQNNELLLNVYGDTFEVASTSDSFKYKSAKLKVTYLLEDVVKTKSSVVTINFKKALTPKITVSNAKLIRGLYGYNIGTNEEMYGENYTYSTIKYANMPAGAKVMNIRFADQADYTKYNAPEFYGNMPKELYLSSKLESKLSLGKDVIDLIYDIRTVTGDVIQVPAKITITIADSISFKADVKSMNLYNSAEGSQYGKYVTFYDAKGHAVKVTEIVNAEELKKAGIGFAVTAKNSTDEQMEESLEEMGADAVKFYVDDTLKRGVEKTYTVKAKVAVIDSADRDHLDTWKTTTAAEKVLTFKIVLKK